MSFDRHQAVGAYRRWEPPSFDAREPESESNPEPLEAQPAPPAPEPEEPAFKLPTADDIEKIHDAAHKDGYAAGYEEGTARGRMEALQLHTLVENLDTALKQLDQDVAEDIVGLAIEMTAQMVKRSIAAHPENIVDLVREALQQLPQVRATIHIHPDDAALVREYIGEQMSHHEHRIYEDETFSRGGCIIEAEGATLDATVQTRWRRIMETMNADDPRWDPKD
ncbi:MAG TPA: flagellar assembly protein FliH [Denitromonas sp.]|uniref:flagellar assembly protein FliH n=1 Tax=Denitromonas sp. TaxID=2734609 RepID=UPI001D3370FC|nr:flagellar assembly protein FliH [Rhodocyclaceae bacterium]MCP5222917.1 flagellar assembly protein FliH [Zoogloeaceae bacterium]HPR06791.1 flagellar assembly protein FliH [Denitromonas sp.]HQU88932.1 flagellar assembly protein FliH [Denitromonas sp.]HQV14823.1 flagellar assembly protein FliH [Denitromonas sp.]